MFKEIVFVLIAIVSLSANASAQLGPKEIIEQGSFSGWKEISFKPEFLHMGFVYGQLEEVLNPTVGSKIRIKTKNLYLPNNSYTNLATCTLTGSVNRISEYSQTRYEIAIKELLCPNGKSVTGYPVAGFINGRDNFLGLTNDDFKNYKNQEVYIFLLPSNADNASY